MSWLDRVQTDMTIKTGDGVEYTPDYLNATKLVEYNISVFEFSELAGSLVYRGEPRGRRYALELYFRGEDNLDTSAAFEASAANKKAWVISHPIYGAIQVQPVGMEFDNTVQNVTRINCSVIETINIDGTIPNLSAEDKILQDKQALDAAAANAYLQDVDPEAADRISVKNNMDSIYADISKQISDNTDFSDFFNAYNEVNTTINKTVFDTLVMINQVQAVLNMPATFADTLARRLRMFELQFSILNGGVANIVRASDKRLYQAMMVTAISGMVLASVTNPGTLYGNRKSVLSVIDKIYQAHRLFMANLDTLQSTTGAGTNVFIPNPEPVTQLSQLVGYALDNLLQVANNAKQERLLTLEEDSDLIQLARRFYGLQPDDSTITTLKDSNDIGISEMFEIKKGRQLVYYV